jgi:hypothetical protein
MGISFLFQVTGDTGKDEKKLQPLTHSQIGVKFGPMYRHPILKQTFRQHFFGTIISAFEIKESL